MVLVRAEIHSHRYTNCATDRNHIIACSVYPLLTPLQINASFNVQIHEISTLGPFFVAGVLHHLPSKLRRKPEIEASWNRLYFVMIDLMKRAYPDVEFELTVEEKDIVKVSQLWNTLNLAGMRRASFGCSARSRCSRTS